MISFKLTDEQEVVREAMHDFAERVIRPAARDADEVSIDWFTILFYIAIFLLIMYLSSKGAIVAPGAGRSSRSGSGGGWSSGGGGFSGGGGGFGGGGSSGSW